MDDHIADVCGICGVLFTHEEWDIRHTAADGGDIHEECCERAGPCAKARSSHEVRRMVGAPCLGSPWLAPKTNDA